MLSDPNLDQLLRVSSLDSEFYVGGDDVNA